MTQCLCGSGKEGTSVSDGYGIYLCTICEDCEEEKISKFRSDIMKQYECEEQIEEDY